MEALADAAEVLGDRKVARAPDGALELGDLDELLGLVLAGVSGRVPRADDEHYHLFVFRRK